MRHYTDGVIRQTNRLRRRAVLKAIIEVDDEFVLTVGAFVGDDGGGVVV
jgi:hypothetical protein